MSFTVSPQSSNARMSFVEGSELIDKIGLRVQLFGKDLDKLFKNMEGMHDISGRHKSVWRWTPLLNGVSIH